MITLITAVPGSGKTLYAVELIDSYNQEGRTVYHNISGLRTERFARPDLILDAPDDWRDTPHGSVVIYDECQQPHLYPATAQRGLVGDERLTAMETHRHSGHDLIFITQAPTLVHHHVRKLCGRHIHLYRARGLQKASRYEWSHTCDDPNNRGEQQRADFTWWSFPKRYYDYYQSATIHTHKFVMPTKLKWLLIILIPGFVYLGYRVQQSELLGGGATTTTEPATSTPSLAEQASSAVLQQLNPQNPPITEPQNPQPFVEIEEFAQVTGCAVSKKRRKCNCYSNRGNILDMSYEQCLLVNREGLSKSIIKHRSSP